MDFLVVVRLICTQPSGGGAGGTECGLQGGANGFRCTAVVRRFMLGVVVVTGNVGGWTSGDAFSVLKNFCVSSLCASSRAHRFRAGRQGCQHCSSESRQFLPLIYNLNWAFYSKSSLFSVCLVHCWKLLKGISRFEDFVGDGWGRNGNKEEVVWHVFPEHK